MQTVDSLAQVLGSMCNITRRWSLLSGSTIPAFYLMTVHVHWTMDMDMDYIVQGVIPMQMVACLFFQDVPWLTFLSSNLGLRDEN